MLLEISAWTGVRRCAKAGFPYGLPTTFTTTIVPTKPILKPTITISAGRKQAATILARFIVLKLFINVVGVRLKRKKVLLLKYKACVVTSQSYLLYDAMG